jgi:ABC-type dipeptide/oligopeptide/nickel transport system permease component
VKLWFYIGRRLLLLVPVLLGVTFITFALTRIVPGDPIEQIAGPYVSAARKAEIRHSYALDRPFYVQYGIYVKRLVTHGDLGVSLVSGISIGRELSRRFMATFELTSSALLIALIFAVPFGIGAALKKDSWLDGLARIVAIGGVSIPVFWSGIMLSLLLSYKLGWAPPANGRIDPTVGPPHHITGLYTLDSLLTGNWRTLGASLESLWLPATVMGFAVMAPIMRLVRQGMIEALESPPATALKALGAKPSSIVLRHCLKNAMLPVVTMIAVVYGYLLGGSVLVETVFSWPGMGLYVYNAITSSDFPAVQGFILYATTMYVAVFLLLDLAYLALDPRIKY